MIDFSEIAEQTPAELRKFGLVLGGMIAGMFGLVLPFVFSGEYRTWPWIVGGFFALWAVAHPRSLRLVYRGWMHIALILGFVNTRIIMFILFYGLFLPIGAAMRLFGWDAMARKLTGGVDTYRVPVHPRKKDHMSHPF